MTTDTTDEPTVRSQESGRPKARRTRAESAPRTWVPAVEDGTTPRGPHAGPESHIVRGED
ncbi:hypothetical protein H0H10_13580 [Streptomyces sp. TRM S81-3]|uniref:Uncharacterized protein n=1 Tax=Streptomyces griseicoloratus TaxID=2752516 RepID=A0A926QQB4_9ACTN|nr:hypothetical protein [Streptomyces griseicoloratus]MBD0420188.1 hypothetical protein [Streptomyces griseicoloratus]